MLEYISTFGTPQWIIIAVLVLKNVNDVAILWLRDDKEPAPVSRDVRISRLFIRPALWVGILYWGGFF